MAVRFTPSWSKVGVLELPDLAPAPAASLRGRVLLAERRDDLVADLLERHAERLEDARGDPLALAHEPEEEVLGTDVAVAELAGLVDRELDDLLRAWRERDLARRGGRVAPADDEFDGRPDLGELDAEGVEDPCGDAFAFTHEAEQEVLRADVVVVEPDGLVLGEGQHALRPVVEAVERSHQTACSMDTDAVDILYRLYVRSLRVLPIRLPN